ncbi:hypothetical protein I551_7336 [Mycobacterium ulcerans str. Harvey]|uniref:Uncharacterized protein n=1 Tax=Mycobacterium ulcerans str. Harvey TaxID=1299332 RepID=A0ABN0QNI6_MYCUL|nr:hypothetical protein I551_7336 [Mycobacterium ulcerans str. Harvey]
MPGPGGVVLVGGRQEVGDRTKSAPGIDPGAIVFDRAA